MLDYEEDSLLFFEVLVHSYKLYEIDDEFRGVNFFLFFLFYVSYWLSLNVSLRPGCIIVNDSDSSYSD